MAKGRRRTKNDKSPATSIDQRRPPENEEEVNSGTALFSSVEYSGPLPPPGVLSGFEDVVPGSAERVIQMAERQASHRQELEKAVVQSNIKNESRGQISGTAIAVTALASATIIGVFGNPVAGAVSGIFVVGLFGYLFRAALKMAGRSREG